MAKKTAKKGPSAAAIAKGTARKSRATLISKYLDARSPKKASNRDAQRREELDAIERELESGQVMRTIPVYDDKKTVKVKTAKGVRVQKARKKNKDGSSVVRKELKPMKFTERMSREGRAEELRRLLGESDTLSAKATELRAQVLPILETYAAEIGVDGEAMAAGGFPREDLVEVGLLED